MGTAKTRAQLITDIGDGTIGFADNTTGDIAAADARGRLEDMVESMGPGDVQIKNVAYTFGDGDAHETFRHTDGTARIWTLPLDATFNFPIGTSFVVLNEGTAIVTLTAEGTATSYEIGTGSAADVVLQPQEGAVVYKSAVDAYVIMVFRIALDEAEQLFFGSL